MTLGRMWLCIQLGDARHLVLEIVQPMPQKPRQGY
jgi:hypothetical protein